MIENYMKKLNLKTEQRKWFMKWPEGVMLHFIALFAPCCCESV